MATPPSYIQVVQRPIAGFQVIAAPARRFLDHNVVQAAGGTRKRRACTSMDVIVARVRFNLEDMSLFANGSIGRLRAYYKMQPTSTERKRDIIDVLSAPLIDSDRAHDLHEIVPVHWLAMTRIRHVVTLTPQVHHHRKRSCPPWTRCRAMLPDWSSSLPPWSSCRPSPQPSPLSSSH